MLSTVFLTSAFAALTSAHFELNWPPNAGFSEDTLGTAPCGGATVVVNSSAPEIQVDRFAVSITNTHPEGEWSYRATLATEEPYNFTQIVPIIDTKGLGDFCLEYMHAPAEWAGRQGILQVVNVAVDGELYQCAPVTFVAGSNTTRGPSCSNSSNEDFTATWSAQQSIGGPNDSFVDGASTTSSTGGSAPTGDSTTTSSALAAVKTMGVGSFVGGLGLIAYGLL